MTQPTSTTAGHTLVETIIGAGALMILTGGVFALISESTTSFEQSVQSTRMRRQAINALSELRQDLAHVDPRSLTIDSDDLGDIVQYQLPMRTEDGEVLWGAGLDEEGEPRTDFFYEVRVVEGVGQQGSVLVRSILDDAGIPVQSNEVLAHHLDSSEGNALELVRDDAWLTIIVRLRSREGEGSTSVTSRVETGNVRLRNVEEDRP